MAAAFAAVNFYAATNSRASCDLRTCQIFTIELQLRKSCELRCSYVSVYVSAPENLTLFQNYVILLKKDFFRAAFPTKIKI